LPALTLHNSPLICERKKIKSNILYDKTVCIILGIHIEQI